MDVDCCVTSLGCLSARQALSVSLLAHAVGSSSRPLSNLIYPSLLAGAYSKHQTHFQDYANPAFASAIFPGVEYLTTLLAVAVPPGGVPQAALSFLPTAGWTPCAPHVAVLRALEELGNDDGYLLLTNQGHTVLLLPGERSSDGKCHQLYLVNSLGSQLQPAGSSSSSDGRGILQPLQPRWALRMWSDRTQACRRRQPRTGLPPPATRTRGKAMSNVCPKWGFDPH